MTNHRYLRPAEVCEILRISPATLWQWVLDKVGFPRPIRVSAKHTLFEASALDTFVKASSVPLQT
jgi:predicted DNA-binding transcriptional regulator AlpA